MEEELYLCEVSPNEDFPFILPDYVPVIVHRCLAFCPQSLDTLFTKPSGEKVRFPIEAYNQTPFSWIRGVLFAMYFWMQKYLESCGIFEYELEICNQKENDFIEAYIKGKAFI